MTFQQIDKETFPNLFEVSLYKRILSMIGAGIERSVHVREICRVTGLEDREVRKAIETIRRAGVVICADCAHGYYYPETLEELGLYVRQEEKRARSTFYTLQAARHLYNQLSAECKANNAKSAKD